MIGDFRKSMEEFLGKKVTVLKVEGDITKGILESVSMPHINIIVKCKDNVIKFIRGSEISEIILKR